MYSSEKPHPIDFYKDENEDEDEDDEGRDMIIDVASSNAAGLSSHHHHHHQNQNQIVLAGGGGDISSGGEDSQEARAPAAKKRAETWVQDETRALIGLRGETDGLFNTSKSNKHLWDQISAKMRERGFDRSPTMCTDKWRNLLKEFKKAKQQDSKGGRGGGGGGCSGATAKMSYYKDIERILRERNNKDESDYKSPPPPPPPAAAATTPLKVDSFMQFSDKGIDDTSITFGPIEANGRPTLNLERQLDHDGHPLAITAVDAVAASGVSPWNWRETPENGERSNAYDGRVISVKLGEYTKRIGVDGTPAAIKEAIKSAFMLRTKRLFWLEDEDNIVRTLDRDMPLGNYTLHLDEGLTIKVCVYGEPDHMGGVHTEEKTLYSEDDFRDFLSRRGWTSLREYNGYRSVESMEDLCPGAIYRGVN